MFDLAALVQITANISVAMYNVYHLDTYIFQQWHVYVAYLLILWFCTALVVFANRAIPATQNLGMFFVIIGGFVTIVVVAAMPKAHADNHFVWGSFDENNLTGWQGGVAFLLGVLNGAFTIGTPDAITHMAEELPHPKKDLPKAIGMQLGLGFLCQLVPPWGALESRSADTCSLSFTSARCLLLRYLHLVCHYGHQRSPGGHQHLPPCRHLPPGHR